MQSAKYAVENFRGKFFLSEDFYFLFHSVEDIKIYHFVVYLELERWEKQLER